MGDRRTHLFAYHFQGQSRCNKSHHATWLDNKTKLTIRPTLRRRGSAEHLSQVSLPQTSVGKVLSVVVYKYILHNSQRFIRNFNKRNQDYWEYLDTVAIRVVQYVRNFGKFTRGSYLQSLTPVVIGSSNEPIRATRCRQLFKSTP